jgi:copper resistance protein D
MSGIYNAYRGLGGSLVTLARSDWGVILDAKLALVGTAIVLGGINWLIYLPRVRHGASSRAAKAFLTILRVEAVTMIGVLSAAAVLAHTAPGAHLGLYS